MTDRLIDEARAIGDQIHTLMLADERFMASGLTLLAALASIAIAQRKQYFLMALPFALAVLLCFVEQQHARVAALGGYKSVLEEALRRRTDVRVPAWETVVAPTFHRKRAVMALWTLLVGFYAASVYAALRQASLTGSRGHWGHRQSHLYIGITVASIVLGTLAICIAATAAGSNRRRTVETLEREGLPSSWICPLHGNEPT